MFSLICFLHEIGSLVDVYIMHFFHLFLIFVFNQFVTIHQACCTPKLLDRFKCDSKEFKHIP
jgi:hypothetical protein